MQDLLRAMMLILRKSDLDCINYMSASLATVQIVGYLSPTTKARSVVPAPNTSGFDGDNIDDIGYAGIRLNVA